MDFLGPHMESLGPAALPPTMQGTRWQRFEGPNGQGSWWWNEATGAWFMENGGIWQKYSDPDSGRIYWWKDDAEWFWERSGSVHV